LDRTIGRVRLAALPKKFAKVWHFIVEETDLALEATNELVGWHDDDSSEPAQH
jgi:hypothetical protein